jgi:thymidylate kinase
VRDEATKCERSLIVVAISGPDGSGKSTLSDVIRRELAGSEGWQVVHLWLRWNPRRTTQNSSPSSTVSASRRGHPLKRALALCGMQRVWIRLATRSYQRQLDAQLGAVPWNSVVVADRFTVDFLADQIGGSVIGLDDVPKVYARLPQPTVAVIANASDEVLRERIKPGDDPEIVIERAKVYRDLATALGIQMVDSTVPAQVEGLVQEIRRAMAP